jgi:predicted RNA binding protein YcfA (HicA-like mRNA interferase family)
MPTTIKAKRFDGHDLIKQVGKVDGINVRRGKGDHVFIDDGHGHSTTIPDRTLGKGIYHAIIKQLKPMGIIVSVIALFILTIIVNL